MLQNYLVCGGNASETIDFFGLNAYEWCGNTVDYMTSGYSSLQNQANGYPAPIFFSETGCITPPPRTFADQAAILGPQMDSTWSGAIVYEWIQEANKYGLVSYSGGDEDSGGIVRSGTPVPRSPDYTDLKSQWATLKPTGVKLSDYSASASQITTPACPSSTPSGWGINGNPAIPTIGQKFNPSASQATVASQTGSPTSSSASASPTAGSANGGQEVAGMAVGLGVVMLGFVVWL